MKAKKMMTTLIAALALNLSLPIFAKAESLDTIKEQESQLSRQGEEISVEIQLALNDVNEKYQAIEDLKTDIAKAEKKLATSEKQIKETKETIAKRKEVVAERLQDMQLNGTNQRTWQTLLDSESFSDFIGRAYALTVLQDAEKTKIESLFSEKDKLEELQTTVKETKASLETKETELSEEAVSLDGKLSNLKQQLSDNQATLTQLAASREAEEKRLADEAAKQAAAEKAAAEKAKAEAEAQKAESTESSETASESTTETTEKPAKPTQPEKPAESEKPESNDHDNSSEQPSGGKTRMMESTAYSWREVGASHLTATGLDLRQTSAVVAVDPSVIPLNTMVQVEGYGVAIAADTGGAIKGNILDVHFDSVERCHVWGRRQVKVTILD